jgi:hypothetical protein
MRAVRTRSNLRAARGILAHRLACGTIYRLVQWGLAGWLVIILIVTQTPGGQAAIDLMEFTVTTQADGTILLRWVTRTELDTASFRVYRAETAIGPWDTVITEPDSNSDGLTDTVYEYNDTDVAVGTTYYYLLEEVEVATTGGINRYTDFIRSATAGQPGAPTSTPTATPTATPTSTPGASPTPSRTPSPTATRTTAAAATDLPTDAPTATRQSANTPPPPGQPQPTASLTARGTAGIAPTLAAATPTGQAGRVSSPAAPTVTRPGVSAPTTGGAASATPSGQPASTPSVNPQQSPTVTLSPAVFAAKATGQSVLRSAATRPHPTATQTESVPRNDGWILALGGGAMILAAILGGIVLFLWRRRHS